MPRRKSKAVEEAFTVFEDTDSSSSASSSSASSSSLDVDQGRPALARGLLNRLHLRRDAPEAFTGDGGHADPDAGLVPALRKYFKAQGGLPFSDSCVFVQGPHEGAAVEAEGVVLPPLPPPPKDVVALAVPPSPRVHVAQPVLQAQETNAQRGSTIATAAASPHDATEKIVRRLDAERAARLAGLRPISGATAGTASVDLLNTHAIPVRAVPMSATRGRHRRHLHHHQQQQQRHTKEGHPQEDATPTTAAAVDSTAAPRPLSLDTTPSAGSAAASATSPASPTAEVTPAAQAQPAKETSSPPWALPNGKANTTTSSQSPFTENDNPFRSFHAGASDSNSQHDSDFKEEDEDKEGDEESFLSDAEFWRQLDEQHLASLRQHPDAATARAALTSDGATVPPLRAHVYIEEGNGRFLDHATHAELQAYRAEQQLEREAQEQKQLARRMRRMGRRRRRDGVSDESGLAKLSRMRRTEAAWSMGSGGLDPSGRNDPRHYRRHCLLVLHYARRLEVFLSALGTGVAVLMLIATTLPSVLLVSTAQEAGGATDSSSSSSSEAPWARSAADNLALMVLLVRPFISPLFLFLTLLLLITSLLPAVWGHTVGHWRRRQRQERRHSAQTLREATGAEASRRRPSAFPMARLRGEVQALTAEAHLREHGGPDAEAVLAAVGHDGYTLSPAIAAQLNYRAFAQEKERQEGQRQQQQQELHRMAGMSYGSSSLSPAWAYSQLQQQQQQQQRSPSGPFWDADPFSHSVGLGATTSLGNGSTWWAATDAFGGFAFPAPGGGTGPDSSGRGLGASMSMSAGMALAGTGPLRSSLSLASPARGGGRGGGGGSGGPGTPGRSSPSVSFRLGGTTVASNSPSPPPHHTPTQQQHVQQQQQPLGKKTGAPEVGRRSPGPSEARNRFADDFLLEGGMLGTSANRVALRLRGFQRWVTRGVLGRAHVFPRAETLLQSRTWCLLVCLAMTVVELALLDAWTAQDLLDLLAVTPPWTSAQQQRGLRARAAEGTIGYEQEAWVTLRGESVGLASLLTERSTAEALWSPSSVRDTFRAVYAVRAAMFLLIWLLDVFL